MLNRRILAFVICLCCSTPLPAKVVYEWADDFNPDEQLKLTRWIDRTAAGLFALTAQLPFDIYMRFHRSESRKEPVPWAHTLRRLRQGVNFHVNPEFSLDALLDDWTAAHELSHLLLYSIGRENAWFAEGFASYMQFQVMRKMGVLSRAEVIASYRLRMEKARCDYDMPAISFAQAAQVLYAQARYPTLYWGGAIYFLRTDHALRAGAGLTLTEVLKAFLQCCRMNAKPYPQLINTLDELSGTTIFSREYKRFSEQPGLPDYRPALQGMREYN